MRNDRLFGLLLMGLALVMTVALWLFVAVETIPFTLLFFPAITFLFGVAIFLFDFVEASLGIKQDLESLGESLADDIDDLKRMRINRAMLMSAVTAGCAAVWLYFIVTKAKWEANWWGVPVLLVGVVVALLGGYMMLHTTWFQKRPRRTPYWVLVISVIGFGLCAWLGIWYAEPVPDLHGDDGIIDSPSPQAYNYSNTRSGSSSFYDYWFLDSVADGASIGLPECSDDDCAVVYLGLLLILVVIVCLIGSAFIPHFWVVATMLMLTFMVIKSAREFLYMGQVTSTPPPPTT